MESLFKIAGKEFELSNLEIRFHKVRFCFWSSKPLGVNAAFVTNANTQSVSQRLTFPHPAFSCHASNLIKAVFDLDFNEK